MNAKPLSQILYNSPPMSMVIGCPGFKSRGWLANLAEVSPTSTKVGVGNTVIQIKGYEHHYSGELDYDGNATGFGVATDASDQHI